MGCPFWNQNPCKDVALQRLYPKATPYLLVKIWINKLKMLEATIAT